MAQPQSLPEIEMEHCIAYSGCVRNSIYCHPQIPNKMVYVAGSSTILADMDDYHDQVFFRGHDDLISSIAYSISGNIFATGQYGVNADVLVWDVQTNQIVYRFCEHDWGVSALSFSDDERLLCSIGDIKDGKLIVWDLYTGNIVTAVPVSPNPCNFVTFGGMVKDIKMHDTQCYLFATAGKQTIEFWNLDPFMGTTGHDRIATGSAIVRDYTCLVFSKDRQFLYAGTTTGDVIIISVRHRSFYANIGNCQSGVQSVCSLSNGILIGGGYGEVLYYDMIGGQRGTKITFLDRAMCRGLHGSVTSITCTTSGTIALAGTADGFIYKIKLPEQLTNINPCNEILNYIQHSESHTALVKYISYAPESSDYFATVSYDDTIRLWNASDYKVMTKVFTTEFGHPMSIAYSLDCLYTCWSRGFITSHSSDTGEILWTLKECHREGCSALRMSNNQRFLVSAGESGELRVWELRTREMMCRLKEHTLPITSIDMFSDDTHCITSGRDRSILCWDLRNEKRISALVQKMGSVNCCSLSSDQNRIVSVGQDQLVHLWDLRTPQPITTLPHGSEGMTVDCNHSGTLFATGGTGQVVRLWDYRTFRPIFDGTGHSGTVMSLKFSPDDKQICSVGDDGSIILWNVL